MKILLLAVVGVALLFGGGSLVADHYNKYQNKKERDNVAAVQAEAQREQAEKARVQRLEDAYTKMRMECEKGIAAYDKLTPFTQKTSPRPVCGPAVVQ